MKKFTTCGNLHVNTETQHWFIPQVNKNYEGQTV